MSTIYYTLNNVCNFNMNLMYAHYFTMQKLIKVASYITHRLMLVAMLAHVSSFYEIFSTNAHF